MGTAREIHFTRLYILESLDPTEPPTHERLRKRVEDAGKALGATGGIDVHSQTVRSPDELVAVLRAVQDRAKRGERPILHLEIHGNAAGLEIRGADGSTSLCAWNSIKNVLTNINVATCNALLVTLAVCEGAMLADIVRATDRAPFWLLIGSFERLWSDECEDAFGAFYATLLSTGDGNAAIEALQRAVPDRYQTIFCSGLFVLAFRQAMAEPLDERVERAVRDVKERDPRTLDTPDLRQRIRAYLQDMRSEFEALQAHFFMLDLCPENEGSLDLDYDRDVLRENKGA